MSENTGQSVTVAICTRRRPSFLIRVLESVDAQTAKPAETLVVVNLPADEQLSAALRERFSHARVIFESKEGLDFARNRALREATGEWVLFVDDDVVLDSSTVERLGSSIAVHANAAVINGRVVPLSLQHAGQRLFEANAGFDCGTQPRKLSRNGWLPWTRNPIHRVVSIGSGCCMAVHRERALAIGGFDEALDLGAALGGGGDLDFYWRTVQSGKSVVYEPHILAKHEHRTEIEGAVTQIGQHQAGLIVFLSKAVTMGTLSDRTVAALYIAWRLLKSLLRLGKAVVGADAFSPNQAWRVARMNWAHLGRYSAMQRIAASRAGAELA